MLGCYALTEQLFDGPVAHAGAAGAGRLVMRDVNITIRVFDILGVRAASGDCLTVCAALRTG